MTILRPDRPIQSKRFHLEIGLLLLLVIGGIALACMIVDDSPPIGREGVVRIGVARDLLAGIPRGRQGLIGSLRWTPLPTLLLLPLLRLPEPFGADWAPVIVSLLGAAFLAAFFSAWLGRCGVSRIMRLVIALLFFFSPAVQLRVISGSMEPVFLLMVFVALCFLMHWWETEQLRSLAYLSLALALATVTRYQAAILFVVAGFFVVRRLRARRRTECYNEATLIVFLTPGLYVLALWLITNWLIMGDVFFFLRGLTCSDASWQGMSRMFEQSREWWHAATLMIPALACWRMRGAGRKWRGVAVGALTLLLCAPVWYGQSASLSRTHQRRQIAMASMKQDLARDYQHDWIVYSGYLGYELSRRRGETRIPFLHHQLSFYLNEILEDTRDKRTYLLVCRPEGDGCWEDANLKRPTLFERGAFFTVHERSWPDWQLYRIVRLDDTDSR